MAQGGAADYPDGIGDEHIRPAGWISGLISWLPLLVLGLLMLVALTGILGGARNETTRVASPDAMLSFNAPHTLRSGEFFEMRISVSAKDGIEKPVVAIPIGYWRDLTINSLYPSPAKEESKDGHFVLEFEPLEAGDTMDIKIDGQVNPPLLGKSVGELELRADEKLLAAMPISLRVLP